MSHPTPIKDFNSDPTSKYLAAVIFSTKGRKYLASKKATTYLDSNDLDWLKVTCTEIDIDSGTPKDAALKVLELKSLDEMNAIAEANELIEDEVNIPIVNAPDLSNKTLLERNGSWKVARVHGATDEYVDSLKVHWRVNFALDIRDNSKPDIVCFLANDAPFEGDKLLLSELWCILRMGGAKLIGKEKLRRDEKPKQDRNQEIAPVTVVSASGRNLRIIQGYVDGDKDCLFVRKSRIINVDRNEVQNLEGLMRIACWFLGTPCRKTEYI
ncbi:hypothetical protein F4818DRAFT_443739 [Hypoxylon cercidicola]|nr:hypothetical protein F4818DRAFT_443739 [Hypoxylon cercidicola]